MSRRRILLTLPTMCRVCQFNVVAQYSSSDCNHCAVLKQALLRERQVVKIAYIIAYPFPPTKYEDKLSDGFRF